MFTKILIWEGKRSIINHLLLDIHECNNNTTDDLSTIPNAERNSSFSNSKQFTIRSTFSFLEKSRKIPDETFLFHTLKQGKTFETFLSLARLQISIYSNVDQTYLLKFA